MIQILMVCLGNICRSPMAQVVAQHAAEKSIYARAAARSLMATGTPVHFESAGTHAGPIGQPMDPRARAALVRRGYPVPERLSRRVNDEDFGRFDLILAMDKMNLAQLQRDCPPHQQEKLRLFLDYAMDIPAEEVPDPYYGDVRGFEHVLDLCESATKGLIQSIEMALTSSQQASQTTNL